MTSSTLAANAAERPHNQGQLLQGPGGAAPVHVARVQEAGQERIPQLPTYVRETLFMTRVTCLMNLIKINYRQYEIPNFEGWTESQVKQALTGIQCAVLGVALIRQIFQTIEKLPPEIRMKFILLRWFNDFHNQSNLFVDVGLCLAFSYDPTVRMGGYGCILYALFRETMRISQCPGATRL